MIHMHGILIVGSVSRDMRELGPRCFISTVSGILTGQWVSVSGSCFFLFFFFSSRRRHTRSDRDWSSDVCSSDLFFQSISPVTSLSHSSSDGVDRSKDSEGAARHGALVHMAMADADPKLLESLPTDRKSVV